MRWRSSSVGRVVSPGGGVLRDLAEDPGVGGGGAADHDGVAAGLGDHGDGVLGGEDVAIADDGDADGVLDGGDVLPARLAGVAVLAGAGVQGDGVQAAVFGDACELTQTMLLSFQPMRNLTVKGIETAARTRLKMTLDEGQVAQEAGAAVAADDALGGAAEVQVDDVEAGVLADAGGVGQGFGVGAEDLGGDGVLVVVVGQVALALGLAHAGEAVGGGELGHDEAAAGLLVGGRLRRRPVGCFRGELAGVFDEAAENGVGDAGHGGEHGGGRDVHVADGEGRGDAGLRGHGVLRRIVPMFLHGVRLNRKGPRRSRRPSGCEARYFLSAAALAESDWANLRRKRSTRPAVSISFCLPVKKGWQAEQISRTMSPLWVERVSKLEPQAHLTVMSL